jgi:hypothetical protein
MVRSRAQETGMSPTQPRHHDATGTADRGDPKNEPGRDVPKRPQDTTASGDARNDTGEDNQRQQGGRPAEDYIRR